MEEENFLEVLSEVDHRKKRTLIKARKHQLNFDKHLNSVKRERIEAEDEIKKIVEGENIKCQLQQWRKYGTG